MDLLKQAINLAPKSTLHHPDVIIGLSTKAFTEAMQQSTVNGCRVNTSYQSSVLHISGLPTCRIKSLQLLGVSVAISYDGINYICPIAETLNIEPHNHHHAADVKQQFQLGIISVQQAKQNSL